jgi:uncharacterized Zn finger protein
MPRENAHDKGRRLLTEGRLRVVTVSDRHIVAHCIGDSGERYLLTCDPRSWTCSCPALGRCSHLVALMLVVLRPLQGWGLAEDETP